MNRLPSLLKDLALMALLASPAWTQETSAIASREQPRFMVEIDPATYALNGYSAHARVELGYDSNWVLGFGIYGLDFPKAIVDFDPKNRDKGWDVRLKFGAGIFVDRFLSAGHEGAFVGIQAASQQYRLQNPRQGSGEAQYTSALLMPRIGYLWKVGSSGFYLMPWIGVGYTNKVSGDARLANVDYHLAKVVPFVTVHAGWQF